MRHIIRNKRICYNKKVILDSSRNINWKKGQLEIKHLKHSCCRPSRLTSIQIATEVKVINWISDIKQNHTYRIILTIAKNALNVDLQTQVVGKRAKQFTRFYLLYEKIE